MGKLESVRHMILSDENCSMTQRMNPGRDPSTNLAVAQARVHVHGARVATPVGLAIN